MAVTKKERKDPIFFKLLPSNLLSLTILKEDTLTLFILFSSLTQTLNMSKHS